MLRILVIDDSLSDINLLRHSLDCFGEPFQLEVILDGEAALDFIHKHASTALKEEPCVVVIDLHLPKHDGMTVLTALRQAPALAHIKTAVVTSGASPRQEQQLLALGVDLYRSKPTDLDDFLSLGRQLRDICLEDEEGIAA